MSTVATVVLDDVDITPLCIEGTVSTRLNRIGTASVRVNMGPLASYFGTMIPGAGSLLKIYFDNPLLGGPTLWHHGKVLLRELTADANTGYVVFNSSDALELWQHRPVRDFDGDFTDPNIAKLDGVSTLSGPEMVEAMFDNSINAGDGPPGDAEGPLFLAKGTFTPGTTNVTGAPVDWPMTMAQFASLLISTGETDIVITPIELDANGNYGQIDVVPGNYGQDLHSSVAFQYGFGARNILGFRWNEDMSNLCNKLWYYLGPRKDTQHWAANITGTAGQQFTITAVSQPTRTFIVSGDASGLNAGETIVVTGSTGNDGTYEVFRTVRAGGFTSIMVVELPPSSTGDGVLQSDFWIKCAGSPADALRWTNWHANVVAQAGTGIGSQGNSRGRYGVRMDVQILDDNATLEFCLFKKLWLEESWIRALPQEMVHITPARDTEIGSFNIGDLVLVEATSDAAGGFSGAQRVYEYTISWDADSVPAIGELQTSPNGEGLG